MSDNVNLMNKKHYDNIHINLCKQLSFNFDVVLNFADTTMI